MSYRFKVVTSVIFYGLNTQLFSKINSQELDKTVKFLKKDKQSNCNTKKFRIQTNDEKEHTKIEMLHN